MNVDIHKGGALGSTYFHFMVQLNTRDEPLILVEIGECDQYLAERYGVW